MTEWDIKDSYGNTGKRGDIPVQTGLDDKWRWQQPPNAPGTTTGSTDITISDGEPARLKSKHMTMREFRESLNDTNGRAQLLAVMCAVVAGEVLASIVHAAAAFIWGLL